MTAIDRRKFLKLSGGTAGGAVVASTFFHALSAAAGAQTDEFSGRAPRPARVLQASSYGPLAPVPDQRGIEVLALSTGFSYVTFSRTGGRMADGTAVPRNHDGMAAFAGPRGRVSVRLIRNHENRNAPGDFTGGGDGPPGHQVRPARRWRHDLDRLRPGLQAAPGLRQPERHHRQLRRRDRLPQAGLDHLQGDGCRTGSGVDRTPPLFPPFPSPPWAALPMRRCRTTPEPGSCTRPRIPATTAAFYRFRPVDPADLTAGGTLEMLGVAGQPNYNTLTGQTEGQSLPGALAADRRP